MAAKEIPHSPARTAQECLAGCALRACTGALELCAVRVAEESDTRDEKWR